MSNILNMSVVLIQCTILLNILNTMSIINV